MADVGSMNIEEGKTLQRPPSLSLDPNNTSSMDADPYDDASSGGVYTLDDIDIGETSTDDIDVGETSLDDVYSDCVTTLLEAVPDTDFDRSIESSVNTIVDVTEVSNTHLNNNTKDEGKSHDEQAPPPVYFELETVSDRQGCVITPDMQPSVQEITQAFEALSGDHQVQGLKKQTFDDDFTPVLHDIPPSENPFEGFEVVEDTAPVYEHGKPKSGETTDTIGDQTVGVSLSGTGEANGEISERILSEPIYDVVPSRDSSERGSGHSYMSLLPEEPIYEVVCHDTTANGQTGSKVKGQGQCKGGSHGDIPAPPPGLGSVYSVAKGAVDKSQNQTNLPSYLAKGAATSSMYDIAKPIPAGFAAESVLTRDDFMVRSHPPGFVSCKQGSGRPYSVHFLESAGAARKGLKTPPKALEDGDYDRLKFLRFNSKKLKSRSQFYIGYNGEDDTVLEGKMR